ncbi:MAG: O-antigen ligase family protein [Bacteroidota bacterium]
MKKNIPISSKPQVQSKRQNTPLKTAYYLLLFAYLLIPVYTPNFYTLDSNGPKFLSIAILNLVSLIVFLLDKDFRRRTEIQAGFFRNYIGLAYTLFIVISLLSFFQAINLPESIINFAKLFSVFASTYSLYVIFSSDRRYILHVAIALSLLLLFDCLTVFYHIIEYINKNISSIYDIKTVYSHKNVLSAALFIKIPVAIWLMLFTDDWKKKLGYLAFFAGSLAVLFMSARAFYIGLALLLIALVSYFILRYFVLKHTFNLYKILAFTGFFVVALLLFSLIQHFLYPVNKDTKEKFNTGVVERLSTIKPGESSSDARLANWKRSLILIKEHPLLGVGTGNWKVEVLKYENPLCADFNYAYKNHNDFIEVTAETGIFGGLAFISIILMALFFFIKVAVTPRPDNESLKYLFLPAFGLLAYSVDAFFNFPADRPEIQALLSFYVAMAIAFSPKQLLNQRKYEVPSAVTVKSKKTNRLIDTSIAGCCALLTVAAVYALTQNAVSLHYQLLAREDNFTNNFKHPASLMLKGFPAIPNLTCLGEPIVVNKARYLIVENRFGEAISLLKHDNSSPYDSRRDYYISMCYDKLAMAESAIYWGEQAYAKQPLYGNLVTALSSRLFLKDRQTEGMQILDKYLTQIKTDPSAWIMSANQHWQYGQQKLSLQIIDQAAKYLPSDTAIKKLRENLHTTFDISPYQNLYERANKAFNEKQYPLAITLLNDFITKKPQFAEAYSHRALCLFFTAKHAASILDINKAFELGITNRSDLLNLRGINYSSLGESEKACQDFKLAMENGNAEAVSNYHKFCDQKE